MGSNPDSSCTDAKGAEYCMSARQQGFLTCDDDFCADCGRRAHECDKTCGFCPAHRRQLQISMPECSLRSFNDQVAELNAACCDQPGVCDSGVPNTCDVKCGMVFLPFYTTCGKLIWANYQNEETVTAFSALNVACASIPSSDIVLSVSSAVCNGKPVSLDWPRGKRCISGSWASRDLDPPGCIPEVVDPCTTSPCAHGGTCKSDGTAAAHTLCTCTA